jgi:hypothetical protein
MALHVHGISSVLVTLRLPAAWGFCLRSGPSTRLTTAPRFFVVTLHLFAARGFPPSQAKPIRARGPPWAFAFAPVHPRGSRRLRASLSAGVLQVAGHLAVEPFAAGVYDL